jgi:hypothetical protein
MKILDEHNGCRTVMNLFDLVELCIVQCRFVQKVFIRWYLTSIRIKRWCTIGVLSVFSSVARSVSHQSVHLINLWFFKFKIIETTLIIYINAPRPFNNIQKFHRAAKHMGIMTGVSAWCAWEGDNLPARSCPARHQHLFHISSICKLNPIMRAFIALLASVALMVTATPIQGTNATTPQIMSAQAVMEANNRAPDGQLIRSYFRGPGGIPHFCPPQEPDGRSNLCYVQCNAGYIGHGSWCYKECQSPDWIDWRFFCYMSPLRWDWNRDSYFRGVGSIATQCGPDFDTSQEQQGLICYTKCAVGYNGIGPLCYLHGVLPPNNPIMSPAPIQQQQLQQPEVAIQSPQLLQ